MVLGRDLGPSINSCPAMTRKILKESGKVVVLSTVRSYTDETVDPVQVKNYQDFDNILRKALGNPLT